MLAESLTDREHEILALIAEGHTNREIAARLFLTYRTVKWYNTQIYSKLGVTNREQAVEQAQMLGLLNTPDDGTPAPAGRHNLPNQTTPFIGRQGELADLDRLIADADTPLITILAPGGMGKTRLALAAAERQLHHFADGVFFVPLAPLSDPNDIVTTIAENAGFSFYGSEAPRQQLLDYFRERNTLLVLDNFEHLMEGAPLVTELIQIAPDVKVLATSREKLNLSGETVFSLSGLHFPTWETLGDALEYDAVRLFMQSAHRARPDLVLQTDDLDYLARICRLTAGMPLGIVLAAGWLDVLSLEQIAAEIQKGIDILETEQRDIPERHRSVRATFERTWQRLTGGERAVFSRLSVFRGGFTLSAAQTIAGANAQMFRRLAQKALIQAEAGERFAIHELLRQFGEGKLAETGELAEIQAGHTAYFADLMAELKQDIKTDRQVEALARIDPDFENVRTAWLYLVRHEQWEQISACLHSLWFYCDVRPRAQEAVEMLEPAVKRLRSAPPSATNQVVLGSVLAHLCWFYTATGFPEKGAIACDEAVLILRQQGSPEDFIFALYSRGMPNSYLDKFEISLQDMLEGISIAQSIGERYWEAHLLIWLGAAYAVLGDFEQAFLSSEQALAIFEQIGEHWGLYRAYTNLGMACTSQKRYKQAQHWLEQALITSRLFDHVFTIAMINIFLADLAIIKRDFLTSHAHLRQALRVLWAAGRTWVMAFPLVYVAQMFADQNAFDRAVEILAIIEQHPTAYWNSDKKTQTLFDELKSRLEPERFTTAWERGHKRGLSTLVTDLLTERAYD